MSKLGKREVVAAVLKGQKPPYVPWSFWFTEEASNALCAHYQIEAGELPAHLNNHILPVGGQMGIIEKLEEDRFRDRFGVVWDRSRDKDIGVVENCMLPEPVLDDLKLPPVDDERIFGGIEDDIHQHPDCFRLFPVDFSLFERAWSLRGFENLLMDFLEEPDFVHDLLDAIADHNIELVRRAVEFDIDAVYFGDDWGQQSGLIMGYPAWKEFIYPRVKRMYEAVRGAGKFQVIHSCGDVDELFEDLIGIGLNLFNPFQPEVMDIVSIHQKYRERLSFWGGLSTQVTLPHKGVEEVRAESRGLLERGAAGGYVFAPSHAVEGDVPLENMLAFIEEVHAQPGCPFSIPQPRS